MRSLALSFVAAALVTSLAFADPGVKVSYPSGITRVELEGNWPNVRYGVWRSDPAADQFIPMYASDVLCIGTCFIDDRSAVAGQTYLYRFDLEMPDGSRMVFGPYAVLEGNVPSPLPINMLTEREPSLVTARSGLPSPFRSPTATPSGWISVA